MNEWWNDLTSWLDSQQIDWSTAAWIAAAVVVALIVAGVLLAVGLTRKSALDREHAAELRADASRDAAAIDREEAEARQLEAEAHRVRAQADQLAAKARDRRLTVDQHREHHDEQVRKADRLDPHHTSH